MTIQQELANVQITALVGLQLGIDTATPPVCAIALRKQLGEDAVVPVVPVDVFARLKQAVQSVGRQPVSTVTLAEPYDLDVPVTDPPMRFLEERQALIETHGLTVSDDTVQREWDAIASYWDNAANGELPNTKRFIATMETWLAEHPDLAEAAMIQRALDAKVVIMTSVIENGRIKSAAARALLTYLEKTDEAWLGTLGPWNVDPSKACYLPFEMEPNVSPANFDNSVLPWSDYYTYRLRRPIVSGRPENVFIDPGTPAAAI